MSMSEKAAYLRGLADGIKLDESKDTDKLLKAIIDTVSELAAVVDDIDDDLDEFCEQLDAVDEDLADLEECVYDDCGCDCCDDYDDEEEFYDVECPSCGEVITIDDEILDEGSLECPNCGELLEFDVDCDCCCDDCDDCE